MTGNSLAGANSSKHELVTAMKGVQIIQYLASGAVGWLENNYALPQPQKKHI